MEAERAPDDRNKQNRGWPQRIQPKKPDTSRPPLTLVPPSEPNPLEYDEEWLPQEMPDPATALEEDAERIKIQLVEMPDRDIRGGMSQERVALLAQLGRLQKQIDILKRVAAERDQE